MRVDRRRSVRRARARPGEHAPAHRDDVGAGSDLHLRGTGSYVGHTACLCRHGSAGAADGAVLLPRDRRGAHGIARPPAMVAARSCGVHCGACAAGGVEFPRAAAAAVSPRRGRGDNVEVRADRLRQHHSGAARITRARRVAVGVVQRAASVSSARTKTSAAIIACRGDPLPASAAVKRALILGAVNIAVFCVVAELVALGIFYYQHGWLFYLDPYRPTLQRLQDTPGQGLTAVGLHPYFGPTHKPGIPFDLPPALQTTEAGPPVSTNNFGFPSRYDYPFLKTNNRQFIVGIFGGSVGGYFCRIGVSRSEE